MMHCKKLQALGRNEKRVLHLLRRMEKSTKADLAKAATLTSAAVGYIVSSLQELELVHSGEIIRSGHPGQPATVFHLNPTGAYSIGVRLERSSIQTVLINFDGAILSEIEHEMILPPPQETLDIVSNDVEKVLATLSESKKEKLVGIGVAQPFHLGHWLEELKIINYDFRCWDDFNFAKALEQKTGIRVHHHNDGTAAAIAELFHGVGREFNNFIHLFFGPAIGGGVVVNGNIVWGSSGHAADIGLLPTRPSNLSSAEKCDRKWDVLLHRASLSSLQRHLNTFYPNNNLQTRSSFEQAIRKNIEVVEEWLDDCVDALVPAVIGAQAIVDSQVLSISSTIDGDLLPKIRKKLETQLVKNMPYTRSAPKIILGTFGDDAGAIGAATTPFFYNFSPSNIA